MKKYFNELHTGTQNILKTMVLKAFETAKNKPDTYPYGSEAIKPIECVRRDGFIPHSFNCGGFTVHGYASLLDIRGGGEFPRHVEARKEIERQIEYGENQILEQTFEQFKTLLESKGLKQADCDYNRMQELAEADETLKPVFEYIEEAERSNLEGDENSIKYEMQVMYHGLENGKHSASVSVAVLTEAPYFRSHISWAPGVFCQGAKEVEIEWKNQRELKAKLNKALAKVTKAVL